MNTLKKFKSIKIEQEYFYSILSLIVKGFISVMLNYYLINHLNKTDYSDWMKISSLAVVSSLLDLGIGQLIMTNLIDGKSETEKITLINRSYLILSGLFVIGAFFIYFNIANKDRIAVIIFSLIVSARILFIPFSSILCAYNNYHYKRMVELIAFILASAVLVIYEAKNPSLINLLIAYNAVISLAGFIIYIKSKSIVSMRNFDFDDLNIKYHFSTIKNASTYFINNLSTLITYGGFLFLFSTVLNSDSLASISVLHTTLFMNLFQVVEVLCKSKQPNFIVKEKFTQFFKLTFWGLTTLLLIFQFTYKPILGYYAPNYSYTNIEIFLYSAFVEIEIIWLILHSRMQVKISLKKDLKDSSILKVIGFFLIIYINKIYYQGNQQVSIYLLSELVIFSFVLLAIFLFRDFRTNE